MTNNNTEIDINTPIVSQLSRDLQISYVYISSYLTQGYYGFSLALDEEFIPMFGIGSSMFLIENSSELIDENLYELTYMYRIRDEGWDPFVNWHSIYVWLANDFTFIGVIFFMFFLGYLFSDIFINAIFLKSKLAISLLCMTMIIIIFIPANNQLLSYPSTFISFWFILILYLLRKKLLLNFNRME